MSSRRASTRFAVTLLAGMLLASGAGFAISACSSSTTDAPAAADAAGDVITRDTFVPPPADAGNEPDAAEAGQTQDQCIAACNAMSPSAVAKEDAITTCWTTSCKGPCLDDPATGFDAGEAGPPDAGPNPVCGTGAATASADCDECTTTSCCTAWSGCFNDTDCKKLDDCYGNCDGLP